MNAGCLKKVERVIGSVDKIEILDEQGCTSEVRRLDTYERSYVIKSSYQEKYRTWLKREALNLEKLIHENIPVPKYYGFIEELDSSHLIMSFEKGVTLTTALSIANSLEKKELLESFGEFLHQFHERKKITSLEHTYDWLDEQFSMASKYVEKGQCDGSFQLLDQLMSHKPSPVKQTMIHGDCTTDNVLVVNGKVGLFIDVAGMTVGDPRYDESLAIRKMIDEPDSLQAFYKGYKRHKVTKAEFQYFEEGLYEFF